MMDDDFYRYIREHGNGYQIIKGNETYGTYNKLTDALYERDRLIRVNWDWDASMELKETENFYEKMVLPRFIHECDYIYSTYSSYEVWVGDTYKGRFNNKHDAYAFANSIYGRVIPKNRKYRIQKVINGKQLSFGTFADLEEAKAERDRLVKRKWVK